MEITQIQKLKDAINKNTRILVTSHIRPDGDAVGSVLGLGLALLDAGKDVQMVLADGVPSSFRHLSGYDLIQKYPEEMPDLSIVVDCSDFNRVGPIFDDDYQPDVNIDHHVTNLSFAKINIIEPTTPATAEVLAELIPALGLTIHLESAEALLTGIITDTLGFRTANIRPNTLRVAANLMEYGCNLPDLYYEALISRSIEAVRYWGLGLNTLQLEDRILWATLSQADRQQINYPGRDDADLINILTSVRDVDIAVIFVEQPKGTVKVSWRAKAGLDVSQIAYQFGGGGHKPAAGAEIKGQLEEVKKKVLGETKNYLRQV